MTCYRYPRHAAGTGSGGRTGADRIAGRVDGGGDPVQVKLAIDAHFLGRQVDHDLGVPVHLLDGFGDASDAMAAAHALHDQFIHGVSSLLAGRGGPGLA